MPKGILFWVIWVICLLGFLGVTFGGFDRYAVASSGVIVLLLTGLLGWQVFGAVVQ